MSSVGFKDWAVVCDAIAQGRQDVILRKGGIHEGREGFAFEHKEFYLFPTLFHAQMDQVRGMEGFQAPSEKSGYELGDVVEIKTCCRILRTEVLTSWADVEALSGRHVLTEDVVKARFEWEGKGMECGSISVAFIAVIALERPWQLEYEKSYGGCRSWVTLPECGISLVRG